MAEDARIAVRNVRRDALQDVKRMEKDGDISKDEVSRASDDVQKLTDSEVKSIDEAMHKKEAEILEV
jgi:ribosome recycling factor